MSSSTSLSPRRLSIFLTSPDNGKPVARASVYAEILVRADLAEPPPGPQDERLWDDALRALRRDDSENVSAAAGPRLRAAVAQAIGRALGPQAADVLQAAGVDAEEFIGAVIRRARAALGGAALHAVPAAPLKKALDRAARAEGEARHLPVQPLAEPAPALWAYPLGVLATDHVGYLSFDLSRLPDEVRAAVGEAIVTRRSGPDAESDAAVTVYLLGEEALAFDALAQGRFTADGIVARLELPQALVPLEAAQLPAMQNPELADWRLSPGSFAASPAGLIGEDGCESILPADLSLQEFHFHQVLRLTDVDPPEAPDDDGAVTLGVICDYRVSWRSLGHSLGQILYSLPLAPGESVNLAVIDWTRRDEAQRQERTTVDEQLVHNERRDRAISETVEAAVREHQHGSSFMGGIAGAGGGQLSSAISAGVAGSIGGATSSSDGQRGVSAQTVQNVSDSISQVSSAARELQSTVVVQSVQAEHELIETRTVANYNHSHALTILYYEVLRHFRVVTELARRRPAVLVRMRTDWFTTGDVDKTVRENRAALAPALLNAKLAVGFDALERIEQRARLAAAVPPPAPGPPPPANPLAIGDREFVYFTFEMRTGGMYAQDMDDHAKRTEVCATLETGTPISLVDPAGGNVLNQRGSFRQPDATNIFTAKLPAGTASVRWSAISAISFWINPQGGDEEKISFVSIKVTATDLGGAQEVLIDQSYAAGHLIVTDEGAHVLLPTRRAPPPPPPAPRSPEELQDEADKARLIDHLKEHSAYYSRSIHLGRNAIERAIELDAVTLAGGATALEKVENRPVEIVGDYLAYPCADGVWRREVETALESDRFDVAEPSDERLVTLPTRGVFAEAKLGHCNASELIDNTRFWDWQQSPVPRMAPEIAPVTAVTPQPQSQPLTPTQLPSPVVNIVTPPAAPDPTGMSSAMNLLSTSNLFRDMSGRAEVAAVLQNLADNAVKVAGGGRAGAGAGGGAGGGSAGGRSSAAATGGGVGGPRATPTQPSAVNRDLHDLQRVLGQAQDAGLMTPAAAQAAYTQAAQDAVGGPRVAFAMDDEALGGAAGDLLTPAPVHADEADTTLLTYQSGKFAIFVPQAVLFAFRDEITDVKVHLFFTAGTDTLHDLLVHGVRGASNQSDWVTIAVPGQVGGSVTIDDAEIIACLRAAGVQGGPTALRLTGHSRGCDSIVATLAGRKIKNLGLIDRVTFLDEAVEHVASGPDKGAIRLNRISLLRGLGLSAAKMTAYEVTNRSVNTTTGAAAHVPQATYLELPPDCMGAVGLSRLVADAVALKPDIAAKLDALPDLKSLLDAFPLPPRGGLTAKGLPGKIAVADFCQTNRPQVQAIVAGLGDPKKSLLKFVVDNDLSGYGSHFGWGIACHHFFVAEIAHEFVD